MWPLSNQLSAGGAEAYVPPAAGLARNIPGPATFQNLNLSFATQNCNSLNVTSTLRNIQTKITSIMQLDKDILLLSDIRLGEKATMIKRLFSCKYNMFHNSSSNKRGVAILIRNNVNLSDENFFRDADENILIIKGLFNGIELIVGAVYGPNNDNKRFFDTLGNYLRTNNNCSVIIGGDWNCTVSNLPAHVNPDIFDMQQIPSVNRTDWLNDVIDNCNLIDPFRLCNGNENDYSYIPFGENRKNRSRINFFSSPTAYLIMSIFAEYKIVILRETLIIGL